MAPGELHILLERCRAEEAPAWEHFAAWVKTRGRAILRGVDKLSEADGEDAVAETLKSLVTVVRRGEIRGATNAEIDAYVCMALRNRALNILRGRARRREGNPRASDGPGPDPVENPADDARDEAPAQDAQAMAVQQLGRAEQLLLSWPPEDRYLFIAKLNGVSARVIQQTLGRAPFEFFIALTTIDTRFHRLRQRLIAHLREP
jgi:DNA-directed RNA polymerase specialized sigma24 family protein